MTQGVINTPTQVERLQIVDAKEPSVYSRTIFVISLMNMGNVS